MKQKKFIATFWNGEKLQTREVYAFDFDEALDIAKRFLEEDEDISDAEIVKLEDVENTS